MWAPDLHPVAVNGGVRNGAGKLQAMEACMKKQQPSKGDAQKAPATTLQAGAGRESETVKQQDPRPAHWNRYVDSRLKQFCLR